jgi:hypothetical protein
MIVIPSGSAASLGSRAAAPEIVSPDIRTLAGGKAQP